MVPLDGSEPSFRAAKFAIKIAKPANAEIIFMHAVVNPPYVGYAAAGTVIVRYIEDAKNQADRSEEHTSELQSLV